jgi:hypothetical protein
MTDLLKGFLAEKITEQLRLRDCLAEAKHHLEEGNVERAYDFICKGPTIRCTNCERLFERDEDLEQLVDCEDGEIVHGCPHCRTDAHLMDIENQR